MLSKPNPERFTVFEASNEDLNEIYITATTLPIFQAMAQLANKLPAPIAHWRPERQHVNFRSLEFDLPKEAALEFIQRYIARPLTGNWKYFFEPQYGIFNQIVAFFGGPPIFTMLGDTWTGGPITHPDIPIYAAAVRPWMLRMCGEVADGVHVHPFHSRRYLDDVVRVSVDEGARAAGRSPEAITLAVPVMSIVGDQRDELDRWRERADNPRGGRRT